MSKQCPDCRFVNDDSRVFCSSCGAPLDAELRLIQDLEKQKDSLSKAAPKAASKPESKPESRPRKNDDDDYEFTSLRTEEKKSPMPWIILGLIAVIAVAAWLMLK